MFEPFWHLPKSSLNRLIATDMPNLFGRAQSQLVLVTVGKAENVVFERNT